MKGMIGVKLAEFALDTLGELKLRPLLELEKPNSLLCWGRFEGEYYTKKPFPELIGPDPNAIIYEVHLPPRMWSFYYRLRQAYPNARVVPTWPLLFRLYRWLAMRGVRFNLHKIDNRLFRIRRLVRALGA